MTDHFVYVYYNNGIPFYVGMGQQRRHLDHIKYARRAIKAELPRNKLSHKLNTIINIIGEGQLPEIKILYPNLSVSAARIQEQLLIAYYGRADLGLGPLTNMTDGGEGVQGRTTMISPNGVTVSIIKEDKSAYEAIGYHHFNKGRKHSAEINSRKAGPWSGGVRPEHGAKIRAAVAAGAYLNRPLRGRPSDATLEKMRNPKKRREGYLNKRWYYSVSLQLEHCSNKQPLWHDACYGRLPKSSSYK